MLHITKDNFDTRIFGVPSYKFNVTEEDSEDSVYENVTKLEKGFYSCFTVVKPSLTSQLERGGFQFISIRNTYIHAINPINWGENPFTIVSASEIQHIREDDIAILAEMMYEGRRYAYDKNLAKSRGVKLYTEWISNSLFHGYADHSFLALDEKKLVGICTLKRSDEKIWISLLGVLPEYRQMKVGFSLLSKALRWAINQPHTSIGVVTEGENIAANKLYQRNGFLLDEVQLVYHKHVS